MKKVLTRNVTTIIGAVGFRLPTESEWNTERLSWGSNDAAGAFASVLKLPMAGYRFYGNGSLIGVGSDSVYWSSTVDGTDSRGLGFNISNAIMIDSSRALGLSVRLIKNEPYTGNAIDFVPEEIIIDSLPYNTVLNETTNRIWLDRNLGASQVAESSTDADAYGDLYQWGRGTDGHEKINSGTTATLSNTDQPGHGDFILAPDDPFDWRDPQNDDLWQGIDGINNPGLNATTTTTVKKILTRNGKVLVRVFPPEEFTKTGYGALYNWYAVDESVANGGFIDGFTVPDDAQWTELADHLQGLSVAGGKLKSERTDPDIAPRWDSPNTGATDEVNFSALPSSIRSANGSFSGIGGVVDWWSATDFSTDNAFNWGMLFFVITLEKFNSNKNLGLAVRCVRTASLTIEEGALTDGAFLEPVQDADGNWYEVVKIGTQAWVAQNLRTTHYADGTPIPNVTDDTEWEALTTGAYAWYNNDINTPGIVFTDEFITT